MVVLKSMSSWNFIGKVRIIYCFQKHKKNRQKNKLEKLSIVLAKMEKLLPLTFITLSNLNDQINIYSIYIFI